jgi:hypothetical protein
MFASEGELEEHLKALQENGKISKNMAKKLAENKDAL